MKRICTECGREFPLTREFFHKQGDGFFTKCKECKNRKDRERYHRSYHLIKKARYNSKEAEEKRRRLNRKITMDERDFHRYLRRRIPQPKYCIICNLPKKLDLCSINHTYSWNFKDWIYLCRSCHIVFDKLCSIRATAEV